MAKMFYTADEVKTMFGLDDQGLRALVQKGKLRELHDGPRRVFKANEVEALSAQAPPKRPAPADTDASGFALEMADSTAAGASGPVKADTALGAEGIQASDQDRLGLADTDARARTTLAPGESGEGALQLDASGSGSGLLDLTREGDDTSLGAVLDEIYPGEEATAASGPGLGTAVAAAMGTGLASALEPAVPEAPEAQVVHAAAEQSAQVRIARAARPFVLAMILAVVLLGLAFSALTARLQDIMPRYLTILSDNLLYFLIASAVIALAIFVAAAILGRRAA